jgi:hypothetical protein
VAGRLTTAFANTEKVKMVIDFASMGIQKIDQLPPKLLQQEQQMEKLL